MSCGKSGACGNSGGCGSSYGDCGNDNKSDTGAECEDDKSSCGHGACGGSIKREESELGCGAMDTNGRNGECRTNGNGGNGGSSNGNGRSSCGNGGSSACGSGGACKTNGSAAPPPPANPNICGRGPEAISSPSFPEMYALKCIRCYKNVSLGKKDINNPIDPDSIVDPDRDENMRIMYLTVRDRGGRKAQCYVEYTKNCQEGTIDLVRTFIPPAALKGDNLANHIACEVFHILKKACFKIRLTCKTLNCVYRTLYNNDKLLKRLVIPGERSECG